MYQGRPDHNAVLSRRRFSADWGFNAGSQINGGLAVAGNTVYLDTLAGDLVALNLADGSLLWKAHVDNMVMTTPVVADGAVVVGSGRNLEARLGSTFTYASDPSIGAPLWARREGDHILAFDAVTGKLRWSYRTLGEDMPTPVLVGKRVIFANGDFHAYALDIHTGIALWRLSLDGVSTMASAMPLGSKFVLVATCRDFSEHSSLVAIRAQDGQFEWAAPYGSCDSSPTLGAGRVFVSAAHGLRQSFGYGGRGAVVAVNEHTGRVLWTFLDNAVGPYTAVGSSERAIAGSYADDTYFQAFPSTDKIIAFSPGGKVRWRFHTVAPVKMSPIIAQGRLYVGDVSGLLYVLDSRRGTLLSVRVFDHPFTTSPPIMVGQSLLIANGTLLYAIRLHELDT